MNTYPSYPQGIPEEIQSELKKMPHTLTSAPDRRRVKREIRKPYHKRSMKWKWFILLLQKASPESEIGRIVWQWYHMNNGQGSSFVHVQYIKIPKVNRAMAIDRNITTIT